MQSARIKLLFVKAWQNSYTDDICRICLLYVKHHVPLKPHRSVERNSSFCRFYVVSYLAVRVVRSFLKKGMLMLKRILLRSVIQNYRMMIQYSVGANFVLFVTTWLRNSSAAPFGPCLLWPNGWMDQHATWYGGRSQRRRHCVRSTYSTYIQALRAEYCIVGIPHNTAVQFIFLQRFYFYRATQLCQRGLGSRNSVRLSVRPYVCLPVTRVLCD